MMHETFKNWPMIRFVAFVIAGILTWFCAREFARTVGHVIDWIFENRFVTTSFYMVGYFSGMWVVFVYVGIPLMEFIEGMYNWIMDEKPR